MILSAIVAFGAAALVILIGIIILKPEKKKSLLDGRIMTDEERAAFELQRKKQKKRDAEGDNLSYFEKKKIWLEQAGVGITYEMYLMIMAGVGVGGFLIFQYIFSLPLFSLAGAIGFALVVPDTIVKKRLEKRQDEFDGHLHEALRRMASTMRSGGSVQQAVTDVVNAKSMPEDIRVEFKKVLIELGYDETLDVGFKHMYERIGSYNLKFLYITVKEQIANGGNMAEMFENIGRTINNKRLMDASIKATLSQGKTSGRVLSFFPFIIPTLIKMISPGYFDPMTSSAIGQFIYAGCYGFVFIGMFVINKITDIKD